MQQSKNTPLQVLHKNYCLSKSSLKYFAVKLTDVFQTVSSMTAVGAALLFIQQTHLRTENQVSPQVF